MCRSKNQLRNVVKKYISLKKQESELKAQINDCKNSIYEYFESNNIDPKTKISGRDWEVQYTITSSTKLDENLLKLVLGEDLSQFKTTNSYRRLLAR